MHRRILHSFPRNDLPSRYVHFLKQMELLLEFQPRSHAHCKRGPVWIAPTTRGVEKSTSLEHYDHAASTDLAYSIAFHAKHIASLLANRLLASADGPSRAGVGRITYNVVDLLFHVSTVECPAAKETCCPFRERGRSIRASRRRRIRLAGLVF